MGVKARNSSSTHPSASRARLAASLSKLWSKGKSASILVATAATLLTSFNLVQDNPIGFSQYSSQVVSWDHRKDSVKQAFIRSWDTYYENAWGTFTNLVNAMEE